ncbi:sensor histidine kinase [Streptomyces morookaense]|uniref:ATP-binding protein n=1 Tax=Streptomyces morookaense TaxID=1970 RepID=A0A7Y7B585_STRMO|nr:ATP-binding protein [Streptomyces morookaense]NVK79212.1 ATP-binding protein [Streptomyces morookaense]GHF27724.1 two-component sensor histidine kinase [Streptomyces morookaense]
MAHIDTAPDAAVCGRLAREVHDRIGTGLALALRRLDLLELTATGLTPAERARLADARAALLDTLGVAREVVSSLRGPAVAPAAPVRASLEGELRGFLRSMEPLGVQVQLRVDGDDSWVPPLIAGEVFVVVREALRNALAHAGGRRVTVRVCLAPHEVHAVVADDGVGFDASAPRAPGRANGLLGMEERARALDGTTTVTSAPGRGTTVTVWIPIKGDDIDD